MLAAVLGAMTVVHAALIIHDTARRREAVHLATRATARQAAARAAGRLELLAAETFAPVAQWAAPGPLAPHAAVEALVRGQREGERCRCRELLPALEFFRVELATGTLQRAPADSGGALSPLAAARLVDLARGDAARRRAPRQSLAHLTMGPAVGEHAVVTVVQLDAGGGAAAAVYGLVASARRVRSVLFPPALPALDDESEELSRAGPTSIQVTAADDDDEPGPGTLGEDHRSRETVHPRGALEGLAVTVALETHQLPHHMIVPLPLDRLWMLGLLLAATVVVIGVAAGTTRREALLARARSDFIAGVSHDLRMPLAQILLAGETLALRRERDEAARLTLASSIVREARRLVAIVENILLYSRAGAVELRPRLEPVPVDALLADVVESVQLAVEDAGQAIEVREPPAPLAVLGDRHLVRQALVNLVDNAIKYGPAGQRIRLGAQSPAAGAVRLLVEDEGPGVPPSQRERVFEPYERLARDQTSERTGTGLGLPVVRQIARACGGRVWLEDAAPGAGGGGGGGGRAGTRAVLELRAAELPEPAAAAEAPPPAGAGVS